MSEPTRLRLKRKATEDPPPDYLVFKALKRASATVHYVLQTKERIPDAPPEPTNATKQQLQASKRFFQLYASRKRKAIDDDGVATVVEKKQNKHGIADASVDAEVEDYGPARPLKRPSKGTAVKGSVDKNGTSETEADRRQMQALANYMHQEALEEIKRTSQRKPVASPKLSGPRSQAIHQQRVASNGSLGVASEVDMEDESSFVYDTYILAPTTELGATHVDMQTELGNVGYVVITKEDQSLWETYLEDELSDQGEISDEDDENAEDYYGADYPEDEVASDDEFGRNAYGYRGRASDEEEWDEDTAAWSDDEDGLMKNFLKDKKTLPQFDKYLKGEYGQDSD